MSKRKDTTIILIITILTITTIIINNNNPVQAHPLNYPHYHTYIEPATPYYYTPPTPQLSEDFTLIVKFEVEEDYMKYDMPGIFVDFAWEEQYINGNDFEDDGKAKITFRVDRDDVSYKETVTMYSDDGRYQSDSQHFHTNGIDKQTVEWELLD